MKPVKQLICLLVGLLFAGVLTVTLQNGSAGAWTPDRTPQQLGQWGKVALRDTGGVGDVPYGGGDDRQQGVFTEDPHVDSADGVPAMLQHYAFWDTGQVGWEYSTITSKKVQTPPLLPYRVFKMSSYGKVFDPLVDNKRAYRGTSIVLDDPEDIRISNLLIPSSLSYQWVGNAGRQYFRVAAMGSDFCAYEKETTGGTFDLSETPTAPKDFHPWVRLPLPPYDETTMTCVNENYRNPFGLAELALKQGTSVSVRADGSVVVRWLDLGKFTARQDVIQFGSWTSPQGGPVSSATLVGLGGLSSSQLASAGVAVDAGSGLVVVSPPGQAPLVGRFVDGASSVSLVPSGGVFPGSSYPNGVTTDTTKPVDAADLQIVKDSTGAYLVQRDSSGGTSVATLSLPSGSAGVGASTVGRWFGLGGWAQSGSVRMFTDGTSRATQLSVVGSDGRTMWFKPLRESAIGQPVVWKTTVVAEDDYPVGAQFGLNPGESVLQWTQASVTGTPGGLQATGGASSLLVVQTNQRVLVGRLTSSGGSAGFVTVSTTTPTTSDGTGISVVPLPGSHDYAVVFDGSDGRAVRGLLGDGTIGACTIGSYGCSGTNSWSYLTGAAPGSGQAKGLSAATRALFGAPIHVASVPQPSWDRAHNTYLWSATAVDSSGSEVSLYQLNGTSGWGGWYTNTPETAVNIGGFVDATTLAKINTAQVAASYAPTSAAPHSASVHSVWVRQDTVIDSFSAVDRQILEVHQADTINGKVVPSAITVTGSGYVDTPVATVAGDGTVVLLGANTATGPPGDGHLLRFTAISSAGVVVNDATMSNSFVVGGNAGGHGDSVGAALVKATDYVITPPTATATGTGAAHYVFTVATRGSDDSQLYAVGMTLDLNTTLPTTTAAANGADPFQASSYIDSLLSTDVDKTAKAGFGGSISGAPAVVSTAANSVTMFVLGYDGNNNGKAYKLTTTVNGLGVPSGGNYTTVGSGFPTVAQAFRDDTNSLTQIIPDTPHGLYSNPLSAPNATVDPGTGNVLVAWTGPDGTWISTLTPTASNLQYWDEQKTVTTPVYTPAILTPNTTITNSIGGLIYTPLPNTSTAATTVLFGTTLRLFNQPIPTF